MFVNIASGNDHPITNREGSEKIYCLPILMRIFGFSDPVASYERLWFFSDEFGSRSFEQYYKTRMNNADGYVKSHFDISGYSNNMFSDNPSVISRMSNLLKYAVSQQIEKKMYPLPKIIVVVPDDDIIKCIRGANKGITKALSRLVKFIMTEFERGVSSFKENLPAKSKREGYPHFLWILAPIHDKFSNNSERYKFNKAVEDMAKFHVNTSCLELKKIWSIHDEDLYAEEQDRYTIDGYKRYWEAIDRTVRYCDSVVLKNKERRNKSKTKSTMFQPPNRGQNDQFRWRNPMLNSPRRTSDERNVYRKLPTPPAAKKF